MQQKREHPKEKTKLHPRNKHRERYDFKLLIESSPELAQFVRLNEYDEESIDFFNPDAVKMLNKALLKHYYGIDYWYIPKNYLCPPIPGRADYIHHIADLLSKDNSGIIPTGSKIKCLDIGVGANCVYPIIGNREYGWSFVGSDIDTVALENANNIIEFNPFLKENIQLRLQNKSDDTFKRIIHKNEFFDLSICNPPYHSSLQEAKAGTMRKLNNLIGKIVTTPVLNFGGQNSELWCDGGEVRFVSEMIIQSKQFSDSCMWFSTSLSKQSNLKSIYEVLNKVEVSEIKTLLLGQGNKKSRIVAWTFLNSEQKINWIENRWH
jgi:23S rRNA (adenine1618-N6)-methyltransferase